MDGYLVLATVLLVTGQIIKARNSVNGTIEEEETTFWFLSGLSVQDTTWFLSNLSVVPAMRATIEYDIWYPLSEWYENYPPIITFYYTGQNSPNLRFQCNIDTFNYGQLNNKDLAIPLNEGDRGNKSFCKGSKTFMNSHGRIQVQDFEPKTYFFSLGFECGYESIFDCFQYNVTIYDESNTTRCVDLNMTREYSDMSQQNLTDHCEVSYRYAAIPNQVGDTELYEAMSTIQEFLRRNSSEAFLATPRCLTELRPFVCEIVLPKCLPEENRILLPCRDDCNSVVMDCSANTQFNCDYLPPCEGRNYVSGIITDTDNTKWFLSNLSVRSAMTASIQYHIRFEIEEFVDPRPILTFYYNGQYSPNFSDKYNNEMYGQLFNEKLAIRLGRSGHSENHCRNSAGLFWEHWDCYGRIDIQDFEPKSYSFSIGCEESDEECDYDWNDDWKGWNNLYYEVTIYDESNTTRCVDLNMTSKYSDISQQSLTDHCEVSYQYAAIPNQFGDTDLDGALSRINKFLRVNLSNVPSKLCLKKLKQIVCMIVLPKCLPEENRIILPCRDDCEFYLEGCLGKVINCDYLPPCEGRSGIITDNTTWFLSDLSVRSAMTASIEYHIRYQCPRCEYEILENPPIITFYYNGQDSPNLRDKCNSEVHGQLFNEDLAVPLRGRYREKFWCNDKKGMKVCRGRTKIQDFEPKSYFFSLGFECNKTRGNLKGLKYVVTIYDESNKTSCLAVNMTEEQRIDFCDHSYQDIAFPNPLGHTDPATTISAFDSFLNDLNNQVGSLIKYEAYLKPWNKCLKELKPFLCETYLPQCLPNKNKILLPCRDTCKSRMENCSLFTIKGMEFNCDYLPPCPVTYPNYLVLGLSIGACVIVAVMVTVCCARNRKRISDTCLSCIFKQLIALRNRMKWRANMTDGPLVPRNRAFDACVLYHFDSDDIYVLDTILPELEENRNFKLYTHSRNFTPGRDIKDNIEAAIEDSNSAILLMSQGFVDSIWCKEEFTHCYIENMNDPAFHLFVIMMQPADTLVNTSNYMKTFFETKTYLDVNDPELFTKLATLLDEARKPDNDDVDNHNNDNNDENIDSEEETQEVQETKV